jgi:hypothetical protein
MEAIDTTTGYVMQQGSKERQTVSLAEYHCRYDWRTRKVTEIRDGVFYPTRFASPQGMLLPLNPQESLVVYRSQVLRRLPRRPLPAQQLWLFELVHTA